jgi:hypothetical protein
MADFDIIPCHICNEPCKNWGDTRYYNFCRNCANNIWAIVYSSPTGAHNHPDPDPRVGNGYAILNIPSIWKDAITKLQNEIQQLPGNI